MQGTSEDLPILDRILSACRQELEPLVSEAVSHPDGQTVAEMELALVKAMRVIGVAAMSQLLGAHGGYEGTEVPGHSDVGTGRHRLEFKGWKERRLLTLFGLASYSRAYYHSSAPQDSRWPRDEQVGLLRGQRWTPGVEETVAHLAVATGSYEQGEKTLKKLLGLNVAYKQGQRLCLQLGEELEKQEGEGIQQAFETDHAPPLPTGPAPDCVIASVDGVCVDDHDGGSDHEIKLGRVYRAALQSSAKSESEPPSSTSEQEPASSEDLAPERLQGLAALKDSVEQRQYNAASDLVKSALAEVVPQRPQQPLYRPTSETSTYRATARLGTETFGRALWLAAASVGVEIAAVVLFLADGGRWCWNLCQTHFPNAVQILDVFHLAKHLVEAASALKGEKSASSQAWCHEMLVRILQGDLDGVLRDLRSLTYMSPAKRKARDGLITYLDNNQERMNYPLYIRAGYPISSAMIEGACGHVIGHRMKGSGRGWNEDGADAMARLRAIHCGNEWDRFFSSRQQQRSEALVCSQRAA